MFLSCSISILAPFNISAKSDITPYAGITSEINKYLSQPKLIMKSTESKKSIKQIYSAYVTGDYVNLRTEPSKKSESITKVFFNNLVDVYEIYGDYAKVKYGDLIGYISTNYISKEKLKSKTFNVPYASMI